MTLSASSGHACTAGIDRTTILDAAAALCYNFAILKVR